MVTRKFDNEIADLIPSFLNERNKEIIVLTAALQKEDFNQLQSIAHKWKGFCEPYGFKDLAELAISLELAAKNKNKEECSRLIQQIKVCIDSV